MEAPQIIVIGLWALSVGLTWAKHGTPETGNHNAFLSILSVAIMAGLLWWGGFWS